MSYPDIYVTKAILVLEPFKVSEVEISLKPNEQLMIDLRRVTFVKLSVKVSEGKTVKIVDRIGDVIEEGSDIDLDAIAVDPYIYIRPNGNVTIKIIGRGR